MITPFTTRSGLQIGLRYMPPLNRIEGDAITVQSALLCRFTRRRENLWHLIANHVYRWL